MGNKQTENQDLHCLLISMPQLMDPNFSKTVSLLTTFNPEAAMGFVLNRRTNLNLAGIVPEGPKAFARIPIHVGGPVNPQTGWFIHRYPEISQEGQHIQDDLYLHGSIDLLKQILEKHGEDENVHLKFFLGYAGWGDGQLEREISESSWITADIDPSFLFESTPEKMWDDSLKKLGLDPATLVTPIGEGQRH